MWLTSAAQTMPSVRHAGTAALDSPSPPGKGNERGRHRHHDAAPSSRNVTETDGRAVSSGDM